MVFGITLLCLKLSLTWSCRFGGSKRWFKIMHRPATAKARELQGCLKGTLSNTGELSLCQSFMILILHSRRATKIGSILQILPTHDSGGSPPVVGRCHDTGREHCPHPAKPLLQGSLCETRPICVHFTSPNCQDDGPTQILEGSKGPFVHPARPQGDTQLLGSVRSHHQSKAE